MEFDTNKSVEDLTQEYLAKYDAEYLKCRGEGAPPRVADQGGGEGESELSKRFKRKAKKEGWGKKD